MKILHLTDIHGRTENAVRAIEKESDIDVVLISGDITHFGDDNAVREMIEAMRSDSFQLLAIPGNCDYPTVTDYLNKEGISLHCRGTVIDGIGFFGTGQSLPCPGRTPNEAPEEQILKNLQQAAKDIPKGTPCVLTTHHPPYGTVNDVPPTGSHVGSRSIRSFIEDYQPLICLSGHIHEGTGIDEIGNTKTLNPGPATEGNYAVIEISDKIENITMSNIHI